MIYAHGPADKSCFGAPIEQRGPDKCFFAEAGQGSNTLRRVFRDVRGKFFVSGGVLFDIAAVDKPFTNQDVSNAVEQRDVAARLDRQMQVCHHGGLCYARINRSEEHTSELQSRENLV